jgi:peptide deformylase
MALRTILTAPDPRLKKKAAAVASVDAEVRQLMDDMLETMYAAPGIGLAAPQVGELKRVVVLDIEREDVKTGPSRLRTRTRPTRKAACRCPSTIPTWRVRPR